MNAVPQDLYRRSYVSASVPMEETYGDERRTRSKLKANPFTSSVRNMSPTSTESLRRSPLNISTLISNNSPTIRHTPISGTDHSQPVSPGTALSNVPLIVNPASFGPTADPTPPSSQHPDHASPTSSPARYSSKSHPVVARDNTDKPVICEFVENCDTGSQMRKAISHIFGRNKMCTRQIPQNVWVHFCRKHYQRSRYRNPKEYAKTQCQLVQKQISQINRWYEEHRRAPDESPLSWSLAVRRREQKRIQHLEKRGSNKRKRSNADVDEDGQDDQDVREHDLGREPVTAVPRWLHAQCRGGYTTSEVLNIFSRLQCDIWDGQHINTFPDLEILPELDPVTKAPKSPNGYAKKDPAPSAHQRSHSLGMPSSHTIIWDGEDPALQSPQSQKRRRSNTSVSLEGFRWKSYHHPASTGGARLMGGSGCMQKLAQRPMYTHPEEFPEYGDAQASQASFPSSPSAVQARLHAPTPVCNAGHTLSVPVDDGGSLNRPIHSRPAPDFVIHSHSAYPRVAVCQDPDAAVRLNYGRYAGQMRQLNHHVGMNHQMGQPARLDSVRESYASCGPPFSETRLHHSERGLQQGAPMMHVPSPHMP